MFEQRISGSIAAIESLRGQRDVLSRIAQRVIECLSRGGTVYTAGNGGSAAQALHLAEELIGRYRSNRPALRAICLNADPTALTCIANDFGFDQIFARQCEALITPNDVLIVLSTSGQSPNIIRALETTRRQAGSTIGLLGRNGGAARALCDLALVIGNLEPNSSMDFATDSAHIQDAHQVALHLICEAAEATFNHQKQNQAKV